MLLQGQGGFRAAMLGVSLLALAAPAYADDAYVVGATAAMTGPLASTYGPSADGMRLFIDKLNASGGINGHQVKFIIRDDQSDGTKGAANIKRLLDEDNAVLLVNDSTSTTYQPTIAAVKRAQVPVLFASVCPHEVYPPAEPLMFCTNSFASHYDSTAALDFIKQSSGGGTVDLGILSQTLPIARAEGDFAEGLGKEMHMNVVEKEVLQVTTSDFTPFATKLVAAQPQWVWAWIGWELQTGSLESMRRLGWTGNYLGWSHAPAEDDMPRVADPKFYTIGTNADFLLKLPVQDEIVAAAKVAGISYPASRLTEGWIAGMAVEAALRAAAASGSVTAASVNAAMDNLKIDTKGLRGAPIEWTKANHFRTVQSYRVWRWNGTAVEAVGDWRNYDVK